MKRRTILKCLPVVAIPSTSGCIGWNNSRGYTISIEPIDSSSILHEIIGTEENLIQSPIIIELISDLLNGEEIALEEKNPKIFKDNSFEQFFHFRDNGFYRVGTTTLENGEVTGLGYGVSRYNVSRSEPQKEPSKEEIIPISDLPRYDQWLLHNSLSITDSGDVRPALGSFVAEYLDSTSQEESVLANGIDAQFIEVNDSYIELEEQGQRSASRERVQYSAESVAEDSELFNDYIIERYGIKAANLSSDARDFLERVEANDGTLSFSTDDTDENEFESQERIIEEIQSETPESEVWSDLKFNSGSYHRYDDGFPLRYDGEGYLISFGEWAAP